MLAQSVFDFFQEPRNQAVIAKLSEAGVRTQETGSAQDHGAPLAGLTIVLTGRFTALGRTEAEERLRRLGANVTGSVSKKTSLVVAGEDSGSKEMRARELGIPVLGEPELLSLLDGIAPA